MAGDNEDQAGSGRRRHPATIDLTATEVAAEQRTSADTESSPAAEPPVEAAPAADVPVTPSASIDPGSEPASVSASPEEPAAAASTSAEALAASASAEASAEAAAASAPLSELPPSEPPPREPRPAAAPRRRVGVVPLFGAGLVGGAVALAAGAGVWLKVLEPGRDENAAALAARIAAIELQVRDLSAQAAATPDTAALAGRIAKLEAAPAPAAPRGPGAAPDPALATRLGAAEAAQKSVGDQVAALERRIEALGTGLREARDRADAAARAAATQTTTRSDVAAAEKAEVERLAARMGTLETTAKALQAQAAKPPAPPVDRLARVAVLAASLKNAVDRGGGYAGELAALKPLVDPAGLAPLEPFAAKGVPGAAALSRELSMLAPAMMRAANAATGAAEPSVLEKLQSHAERLVRIRPVSEVKGDDAGAVLARMELRASQGDVAAALTEIAKLPDAARAPAEEWVKRAKAREAAIAAADRIAGDAFAALAKTGS